MEDTKKTQSCPEFSYFGAQYPDARCIDGYLWDLDSCEGDVFTHGGDYPCPFCNEKEAISYHTDPLNGITRKSIKDGIDALKKKHNYTP